MATPTEVKSFITKIAPIAQQEYAKGKLILPSVCIAQACVESSYGTSGKMLRANAMFGIKVGKNKVHFGTAWKDKAYDTKTKECYDGKTYTTINDFFRAYDTVEDSVTDYYDLLCSSSRYKAAVGETDYVKTIKAIQNGGYATGLEYIQTVISIIERNNLTQYDKQGGINVMSNTIKKAVEFAVGIANDPAHGYDQIHRWGSEDYDCSALVISSWEEAGVPVKTKGATYTGNMKKVFLENGFEEVIGKVNVANGDGLAYGDVLLKEGSHVAMFIGNGQIVHASINEKGTVKGGKEGDQTGKEICTRSYYNKPWNSVLRYKEAVVTPVKSINEIAEEVINGKWGSGDNRKERLDAAGYNPEEVQKKVNELLTKPVRKTATHKVVTGDTLSKIAESHHTTVDKIIQANKAKYPNIKSNFIVRGWVLDI